MDLLSVKRLIKNEDGYTLELHINQELSEFAKDFDTISKAENKTLENAVRDFVQENFSGLKIKSVKVVLGSLLIASIPFADIEASASTNNMQSYNQATEIYTVKSGDTLYKIANKYGITATQLKSQNGLATTMIYPGQQLEIPKQMVYTVKTGDTLFIIANKFQTSINQIKVLNQLTTDMIYPGQQLKVPNTISNQNEENITQAQQRVYTVKSGDTINKIASNCNMSAAQLKKYNRLATTMIYPGQTIHIPDKELIDIVNSLPYGVLSLNDRGENVKIIQKAFNRLNYVLSEDGVYDKGTQAVVKDFQSKYGDIANDGIYGSKTRAYLQDALLTDHIIVENPDSLLVLVNKNNALPKDYVPQDLTVPNVNFPFQEYDSKKLMRKDAATALEEMFWEAKRENINLYAVSGYRSYDRQNEIFASKVIRSGMESAGQFSAKPGESEHQTGLAMDLTSPSVNYGLSQQFGETKEGQWIKKNAHKFGFIIRYQKGKESITGYQFEPWHVRYVGKNAAQVIAEQNLTFEEYINKYHK
ncbi:D-alanyl-D-alanine carboxypeptidase [Schinkia azotoformans MEV2011]|uniref:D-alanyl-D-alanine carboxypeptidase n=1 Tax=Schinkia azotoformans MEV2011 TaxID=1348973 RepID=A0A072NHS3_SCHAZ|nr:LysM peptidoglycan-binding domain-containing protein [Schinkia azotoformans]KEF36802.1 D-alanyl-D-alanine carboxypeptidase [Schinkia azotoformans MEV2011]MEC1698181.1 LysM peptidoglycan-binding domain-containing protein [Schinkia azotoformans]MEC1725226.1 LysM peptidoglycan-binding domain-containing protein [Schinkia azotoformans]MEC1773837.1 LysM peptidoglycan-binding domain-containing protein [Schinkia azotoformans]MEC1777946.1 LysM peptidoglycan-binding domain-containing protein [Schinki